MLSYLVFQQRYSIPIKDKILSVGCMAASFSGSLIRLYFKDETHAVFLLGRKFACVSNFDIYYIGSSQSNASKWEVNNYLARVPNSETLRISSEPPSYRTKIA